MKTVLGIFRIDLSAFANKRCCNMPIDKTSILSIYAFREEILQVGQSNWEKDWKKLVKS